MRKVNSTLSVLNGIKDELCHYDVESGRLGADISAYLDTALEFKAVVDQYAYIQLWYKDQVTCCCFMENICFIYIKIIHNSMFVFLSFFV